MVDFLDVRKVAKEAGVMTGKGHTGLVRRLPDRIMTLDDLSVWIQAVHMGAATVDEIRDRVPIGTDVDKLLEENGLSVLEMGPMTELERVYAGVRKRMDGAKGEKHG